MIIYDNSVRDATATKNLFHSNMRSVSTALASDIILERNDDWNTMYWLYLKPENYWYSWFNKLLTGEAMYRKIAQIEIFDNCSVQIDVFVANEIIDRIAKHLDKGDFRVTVIDRTLRRI